MEQGHQHISVGNSQSPDGSIKDAFGFGIRILFVPLWLWLRREVELEMEFGF